MSELFPERFETDRLRFEVLRPETTDIFELYEICSSDEEIEEVTRFLTWDPHETPKETLEFVERMAEAYENGEGGSYHIRPKEGEDRAGEIAGNCGFDVDWDRRTMRLGIWLRKRFWGRGYSGERATAFFALAFDRLDLELVEVDAHTANDRSNHAISKYVEAHGGSRDGLFRNWRVHDGAPVDLYRYSVSKTEWESAPSTVSVTFDD